MKNELINQNTGLPATPLDASATTPQNAEKIYNIDNIANFQHTSQIFLTSGGLPGGPNYQAQQVSFSRDYYNLIVYGQEPFTTDCHITLEKSRCLVEKDNISEELQKHYSPLTPDVVEEVKGFLTLLLCENYHYGWTDESHYGCVAQLLDVKNRTNGIQLYFHPIFQVNQARISEALFELGICGKYKKFNELNHTHWSIKEIDLWEVLHDIKENPFWT